MPFDDTYYSQFMANLKKRRNPVVPSTRQGPPSNLLNFLKTFSVGPAGNANVVPAPPAFPAPPAPEKPVPMAPVPSVSTVSTKKSLFPFVKPQKLGV